MRDLPAVKDDHMNMRQTMLMAGIARQWTDGVDIARVLHSDGEEIAKNRILRAVQQKVGNKAVLLTISYI